MTDEVSVKEISAIQMRMAGRIERIHAARDKITQRLQDYPEHPKADCLKNKLQEYALTLEELTLEHQLQKLRDRKAGGVHIQVPVKEMDVTSHSPK